MNGRGQYSVAKLQYTEQPRVISLLHKLIHTSFKISNNTQMNVQGCENQLDEEAALMR